MSTKKPTTKRAAASKSADATTLATAKSVNIDSALAGLTGAQTKISRTLADIQEELIAKHAELSAVDQAIELKKEEMEGLHGADEILLSMDELRAKQLELSAQAEQDRKTLAATYEQARKDAEQTRAREQAEHAYKLKQDRATEADTWNAMIAKRAREEDLRVEQFNKVLAEREAELARKEADLVARAALVDGAVEAVRKELAKDHAIELNSIKRENTHAVSMTAAEHKATVSGLTKDIAHRDGMVVDRDARISALEVQLKSALEAQTTLAKATVDAAGNKTAQAEALSLMTNIGGNGNGARPRS